MGIDQLNKYITECDIIATQHGWYEKDLSDNHYLMMIITEISEAIQADRSNKHAVMTSFDAYYKSKTDEEFIFPDDCSNDNDRFIEAYKLYVEGTVDSEIADIVIRILSFLGLKGMKLKMLPELDLTSNWVGSDGCFKTSSFTEISLILTSYIVSFVLGDINARCYVEKMSFIIAFVFKWCKFLGVDIDKQIKLKIRYNSLREYKHGGKKY